MYPNVSFNFKFLPNFSSLLYSGNFTVHYIFVECKYRLEIDMVNCFFIL